MGDHLVKSAFCAASPWSPAGPCVVTFSSEPRWFLFSWPSQLCLIMWWCLSLNWLVPATSHIRSFAYITFIAQNTKLLLLFPLCRWANWSLECGRGRTNTEPMCSALLSGLSSPDFLGPFPGLAGNLLTPWCSIYLQPPVVLLNSCRPLVSLVEVFKCQLKTGLDVRACRDQRETSGVFLYCSPLCLLRQGLFID